MPPLPPFPPFVPSFATPQADRLYRFNEKEERARSSSNWRIVPSCLVLVEQVVEIERGKEEEERKAKIRRERKREIVSRRQWKGKKIAKQENVFHGRLMDGRIGSSRKKGARPYFSLLDFLGGGGTAPRQTSAPSNRDDRKTGSPYRGRRRVNMNIKPGFRVSKWISISTIRVNARNDRGVPYPSVHPLSIDSPFPFLYQTFSLRLSILSIPSIIVKETSTRRSLLRASLRHFSRKI